MKINHEGTKGDTKQEQGKKDKPLIHANGR
jgi:hypothetical protein